MISLRLVISANDYDPLVILIHSSVLAATLKIGVLLERIPLMSPPNDASWNT